MDFFGCVDSLVRLNTWLELKIVFIGRQDYELDSLALALEQNPGFLQLVIWGSESDKSVH